MTASRARDIVIVGGGAIGLCTALELARRGHRPLLLERAPDLVTGCSVGSAGLLSPGHSVPLANAAALREGLGHMLRPDSPFSIRPRPRLIPWLVRYTAACRGTRVRAGTRIVEELSVASAAMHEELAREGLDTGFTRRGAIDVYETEVGFEAGRREAAASGSEAIASTVLSTTEARTLEPAISDRIVGGIYHPQAAHCDPARFLRAVADAALASGAELRPGVEVTDVRRGADGRAARIETTDGAIVPGIVVIAAGVWTPRLSRALGVALPIEGGKGYHLDFALEHGDPRIPVYLQEARVIATPFDGLLRLSGTLQLTGLDDRIEPARVRATLSAGLRGLRTLGGRRAVEVWAGIRPCPPDGLPIVGRSARIPNVLFAAGHGMKGLHLAPVTGRLVAQLIAGEAPDHDLAPLHPDRFAWGRRSGRPRSTGRANRTTTRA